jgi:ribosomal protein L37AE/L43A
MTTFDNEIKQKLSKNFFCKICDYNTERKSNLENHLLSAKHIKTTNNNEIKQKISTKHKCDNCEKEYNDRAGLWRHKKKCKKEEENIIIEPDINDKSLMLTLIQQNSELQKQMLEVIKNGTTNINNSMNNSHNKTFNLQFFLNETCKDAMNIMDFVDSIKIQLCDIESIGELGFVNGMSKLIIKNLNALAENMRPVHCNDPKRDSLYVKDANVWEKEDIDNKKIKKAIKYISHKNICAIPQWKAKYPDCIYSDSKKSDQYNHIVVEAMGGSGDNDAEKADKIVKKIAREVTIDKNN